MSSRSQRVAHYGNRAERAAAERYGLSHEGTHSSWKDAEFQNGTPVEIKATMVERDSGETGRFRLYRHNHRKLCRNSGWYVFVAYRPKKRTGNNGIEVLEMKAKRARVAEQQFSWFEGPSGEEAQPSAKDIFG